MAIKVWNFNQFADEIVRVFRDQVSPTKRNVNSTEEKTDEFLHFPCQMMMLEHCKHLPLFALEKYRIIPLEFNNQMSIVNGNCMCRIN